MRKSACDVFQLLNASAVPVVVVPADGWAAATTQVLETASKSYDVVVRVHGAGVLASAASLERLAAHAPAAAAGPGAFRPLPAGAREFRRSTRLSRRAWPPRG